MTNDNNTVADHGQYIRRPGESEEHVAGKWLCHQHRPLPGTYIFDSGLLDEDESLTEAKIGLGNKYPDVIVLTDEFGDRYRGATVELVNKSDQAYHQKTKHSLKYGFVPFWVFYYKREEERERAHTTFGDYLLEPTSFGTYNPETGQFDLGTPLTFQNYYYSLGDPEAPPIFSHGEFRPYEICQPRMWEMTPTTEHGYYVGEFTVNGDARHVFAEDLAGSMYQGLPQPSPHPFNQASWDTVSTIVNEQTVRRIAPVGGRLPFRKDGD